MQTPEPAAPEPVAPAVAPNPFALMMDPRSVLDVVEHSQRLARLKSRIYRPLDKPASGKAEGATTAFDHGIEIEPEFVELPE
ncbi:hypothetical protein M8A51_17050 [Schlegelella sp. S2-27]|uniref:Uncharacterized protein n=1 Tax=Caldimonas mangrovi TaxID=2944811 RepID=A0ABT0YRH1_9BURK|nr:hypothetical protein [Caldimonas mangrovi]MCM5681238.1 hypothetical protein [Caldimonas mangrovi]